MSCEHIQVNIKIKTLDEAVPNMSIDKEYVCYKIIRESFGDFYYFIGDDGKEHSQIDAFIIECP